MTTISKIVGTAVALTCAAPVLAQTHPITRNNPGAPIVVTSASDVIATYLGTSAAFTSLLYLDNTNQFLFNNQQSAVGSTVNLGSFAIGTELVFRLEVQNSRETFFSGLPSRNRDQLGHAAVQSDYLTPGTTLVSFEDLPNSSDFNDLSFSFTGTAAAPVPEAATWMMMILGFALTGRALRVRRRSVVFRAA